MLLRPQDRSAPVAFRSRDRLRHGNDRLWEGVESVVARNSPTRIIIEERCRGFGVKCEGNH